MEGKELRALYQDCRAVSEVYGQLLMIGIVVLAFSGIALTVFSDGGVVKPKHTPHTDLQENFNRSTNTLQIIHSGGEAIDESAIKIIIYANGDKKGQFESDGFSVKNPDGTASSDDVFTLGECIEIDTESMDLKAGEDIDLFFVDKPSQQVIQKTVLQRGSWKLPEWITPHPYGSVLSSSSGWQPTENVSAIGDGTYTKDLVPQKPEHVYQEFQFGIDADEMGISDPLTKVQLKIIYSSKDCSPDEIPLSISYDSTWRLVGDNMTEYHTFEACEADYLIYDISSAPWYVNTTDKLERLKVRFSASGNAAADKFYCIDFVGIHVEF